MKELESSHSTHIVADSSTGGALTAIAKILVGCGTVCEHAGTPIGGTGKTAKTLGF